MGFDFVELASLNSIRRSGFMIPTALYCLYCVVLCSLAIESIVGQSLCLLGVLLQLLSNGLFFTGWVFLNKPPQKPQILFAGIGLYIIGALIHRAVGWSKR